MNENNYTETNLQEIEAQIAKLTEQKNQIVQELISSEAKEQIGDIIGKLYRNTNDFADKHSRFTIFTKVLEMKYSDFVYEGITIIWVNDSFHINKDKFYFADKNEFNNNYADSILYEDIAFIANAFTCLTSNNE